MVHDPENPYTAQFDEEVAFTLSDWYHDEMPGLLSQFISYTNPTGAEPVPNSALMNDTRNLQVNVQPGKTYFFRMANIGAFAGQYFWIEGHTMKIIEVDGVYTEPAEAEMIYIAAAQRYGFLVTMKDDASANFAMVGSMDEVIYSQAACRITGSDQECRVSSTRSLLGTTPMSPAGLCTTMQSRNHHLLPWTTSDLTTTGRSCHTTA